jgi:L-seryl-tRNA(Ser) seleniumtransferase
MVVAPSAKSDLFRLLPSVDDLLRRPEVQTLIQQQGHAATVEAVRSFQSDLRSQIATGEMTEERIRAAVEAASRKIEQRLRGAMAYSLRPVINATGVILHTNLGRAPLSREALEHVLEVSQGYCNLEMDLARGTRGERDVHVDRLFAKLLNNHPTPPKEDGVGHTESSSSQVATIVVNNNAAAVLLTLNTLAEGGEVIVSRGELVEMREVGTTNRTRIGDYEQAINQKTRLLLRVHRSNFEITGFTEQPSLEELSALARKRGVPLMEDLGSGDIFELRTVGVDGEPTIAASLRAGVNIVTFSGDKLLGGPQAGLIAGNRELVARTRRNPLFRALRVDKMFYAALEATLLAYLREDYDAIPALGMMRLTEMQIGKRAEQLMGKLHIGMPRLNIEVGKTQSVIGGGSAPGATLPSRALAISSPDLSADEIARRLRSSETPIIARVEEGRVLLDLRTVKPEQDEAVLKAVESLSR